jgi:dihydrolipoamide dehydrogenase
MKKNKITVVEGEGALAGKGKLKVAKDGKTTELAAKHIIVATGARARDPPLREGGRRQDLDLPPRHGAQGDAVEAPGHRLRRDRGRIRQLLFGHGAEVTIVEMLDRILPVEDADVSAFVTRRSPSRHEHPLTSGCRQLETASRGARCEGRGGEFSTPSSHRHRAQHGEFGLEALGVKTTAGIDTDGYRPHQRRGLYAIGT